MPAMAVDGKPLDEDASEVEEALRADLNRAREDYKRTLECFRKAVSERGLPASEAASRIGKAFAEHELSSKAYNDAIGRFADFVFRGLVPEGIKGPPVPRTMPEEACGIGVLARTGTPQRATSPQTGIDR